MALSRSAKASLLISAGLLTAVLAVGIVAPANAAPIPTAPSSLMDLGADSRTSSVGKDGLDVDGNGVLGEDGHWAFGAGTEQPSYISGVVISRPVYAGNASEVRIGHPWSPSGPPPTTYTPGTLNPLGNGSRPDPAFPPSGNFSGLTRVGLMIDNPDIALYIPSPLQIVDTTDGMLLAR
jgi:hypothetical protein